MQYQVKLDREKYSEVTSGSARLMPSYRLTNRAVTSSVVHCEGAPSAWPVILTDATSVAVVAGSGVLEDGSVEARQPVKARDKIPITAPNMVRQGTYSIFPSVVFPCLLNITTTIK